MAAVAAVAAVCAAGGWSARAADADSTAPAGNAIETARSDYEAITAAKTAGGAPSLALPKQAMPRFDLKPNAPPAAPSDSPYRKNRDTNPARARQTGKATNWLVDAMNRAAPDEKSKTADDSPENAAGVAAPEGDLLATAAALERAEQAAAKARETREDKRDEVQAFNPLDAYMAAWLSARDVASPNAGRSAGGDNRSLESAGILTALNGVTQRGSALSFGAADAPSSLPDAPEMPGITGPAANPFLNDIVRGWPGDAPPAPASPAPDAPSLLRSPETIRREPAPVVEPETASRLSEQLRPQDDAKYFKQLKRF